MCKQLVDHAPARRERQAIQAHCRSSNLQAFYFVRYPGSPRKPTAANTRAKEETTRLASHQDGRETCSAGGGKMPRYQRYKGTILRQFETRLRPRHPKN